MPLSNPSSKAYVEAAQRKYAKDLAARLPTITAQNAGALVSGGGGGSRGGGGQSQSAIEDRERKARRAARKREFARAQAKAQKNTESSLARQREREAATVEKEEQQVVANEQTIEDEIDDPHGEKMSRGQKLIDILSQPLYAAAQAHATEQEETKDMSRWESFTSFSAPKEFFKAFGTGNEKKTPSDLLRGKEIETDHGTYKGSGVLEANESDNKLQKAGKFAGGLAADIALDPISYIPGVAIASAGKGVMRGVRAADTLAQASKIAPVAGTAKAIGTGASGLAKGAGKAVEGAAKGVSAVESSGAVGRAAVSTGRGAGKAVGFALSPIATTSRGFQKLGAKQITETTTAAKNIKAFEISEGRKIPQESRKIIEDRLNTAEARASVDGQTFSKVEADEIIMKAEIEPEIISGTYVPEIKDASKLRLIEVETPKIEDTYLQKATGKRRPRVEYDDEIAGFKEPVEGGAEPLYPNLEGATPESLGLFHARKAPKGKSTTLEEATDAVDEVAEATVEAKVELTKVPPATKGKITKYLNTEAGKAASAINIGTQARPQRLPLRAAIGLTEGDSAVIKTLTDQGITPEQVAYITTKAEEGLEGVIDGVAGDLRLTPDEVFGAFATKPTRAQVNAAETAAAKQVKVDKAADVSALRNEKPQFEFRKAQGAVLNQQLEQITKRNRLQTNADIKEATEIADIMRRTDLTDAKKYSQVSTRIRRLQKKRTDGEMMYETVTELIDAPPEPGILTAAEQIDQGIIGGTTTEEILALRKLPADEALSVETRSALNVALDSMSDGRTGKGWLGRGLAEDFPFETGQGARATSETAGEGLRVYDNVFNAKGQSQVFQELARKASSDFTDLQKVARAEGRNLASEGIHRDKFMRENIEAGLREGENFMNSHGVIYTSGMTSAGRPYSYLDLTDAIGSRTNGDLFLESRVYDGFGSMKFAETTAGKGGYRVGRIESPGTINADQLQEGAELIFGFIEDEVALSASLSAKQYGQAAVNRVRKTFSDDQKEVFRSTFRKQDFRSKRPKLDSNGNEVKNKDGRTVFEDFIIGPDEKESVITHMFDNLSHEDTIRNLAQKMHNNAAKNGVDFVETVGEVSDEAIKSVATALANPNPSNRNIAEAITTPISTRVTQGARAVKENTLVTPQMEKAAESKAMETFTDLVTNDEVKAAEYFIAVGRAVEDGASANKLTAMHSSFNHAVSESLHEMTVKSLQNFEEVTEAAMNAGLMRIINPVQKAFAPHWRNATIHQGLVKSRITGRLLTQESHRATLRLAHKHNTPEGKKLLKEAGDHLQNGVSQDALAAMDPEMASIVSELDDLYSNIVTTNTGHKLEASGGGIATNALENGIDPEHLMAKMGYANMPSKWTFDRKAAAAAAKTNGTTEIEELSRQWKNWEIDDPIEFVAKMNGVMGAVAIDSSIAMEGVRIAKSLGRASTTRSEGMVKFTATPPKSAAGAKAAKGRQSVMETYLPKDTYFDKEVVKEFRRVDDLLTDTKQMQGFLEDVVGPVLEKWKAGVTIYNPGHHVRNLVGDIFMSFLQDGVKNPKYYAMAARMANPKNTIRRTYTAADALKANRGLAKGVPPSTGGRHAVTVKLKNGEVIHLDDSQLQRAAADNGALPDFMTQEDIVGADFGRLEDPTTSARFRERMTSGFKLEEGATTTQKVTHKALNPFDNKVRNVVGKTSELRDDLTRLSHMGHLMEHPPRGVSFASIDEHFAWAAHRVRRAHPDGADLTRFEQRFMKKLMPFYSWTRKALPLVAEAVMLNPGRVMAYPKASYNLQHQLGYEPESLSYPFDDDHLYPSWLSNKITGPQFKIPGTETENREGEMGAAPGAFDIGAPQADIINEYLTKPVESGIGMLNPFAKYLAENLTGHTAGTEIPIGDPAEHFEQMIPGLSHTASMTGYSPLGSLVDGAPRLQRTARKAAEGQEKLSLEEERFAEEQADLDKQFEYEQRQYDKATAAGEKPNKPVRKEAKPISEDTKTRAIGNKKTLGQGAVAGADALQVANRFSNWKWSNAQTGSAQRRAKTERRERYRDIEERNNEAIEKGIKQRGG